MQLSSFRRLTLLLLASSASSFALNANAVAAPFNPAGLSPTALFPASDTATNTLLRSVTTSAPRPAFTNLSLQAATGDGLDLKAPFADAGEPANQASSTLSFSTFGPDAESSVTLRRAKLDLRPTLDASFERLSHGVNFGLPPSEAVNSGVDANLFAGRLQVSSDITVASDDVTPLGQRFGDDTRSNSVETAFRHSFAAKVVDRDSFRWSLAGQMGQVDPRFADFIFTQPGAKSPAVRWSSMATRMDFGAASLSVGFNDVTRLDEVESNRSLTLGFNQSALSVYRRDASQYSLDQGGHWLRRTAVLGASADVIVADVLPNKVAEVLSPIVPFLPNTISASYEVGDALQPDGPVAVGTAAERVRSMSADFTWETRFGETKASYWSREIRADADQVRLDTASDRVIDLAHSIKRGNWRFGGGVSFIESTDETPTTHSRQSRIAPHVSFAYEAEDFPTIEVRVGAADATSIVGVEDIPASAKARQLQVSLDLSNFVQEQLNKPEAKLKLEYRRALESGDSNLGGRFAHQGDQALLLTFSTPLN